MLILPALFEEMNRTRRLCALTGAALARAGVRSWLPDLPGTGDHEAGFEAMDWARWRAALDALASVAAAGGAVHLLAVRGGALLVDAVPGAASLYRLAPPASGMKLLRDLWRARAAADREAGGASSVASLEAGSGAGATIEAAGYSISAPLAADLRRAGPSTPGCPTRTAATAPADGVDVVLPGPPLWRQAEPLDAAPLADALAADWLAWTARR